MRSETYQSLSVFLLPCWVCVDGSSSLVSSLPAVHVYFRFASTWLPIIGRIGKGWFLFVLGGIRFIRTFLLGGRHNGPRIRVFLFLSGTGLQARMFF